MAIFGRFIPEKWLLRGCIVCYLGGGLVFLAMILIGSADLLPLALTAGLIALGDIGLCLVWGRALCSLTLKQALLSVAAASILATVILWLLMLLNSEARAALFMGCLVVSAIIASFSLKQSVRLMPHHTLSPQKLLALGQLAGIPLLGLVVFAFVMAVLRSSLLETFNGYLVATLIVAAILILFAATRAKPLAMRSLWLTFIVPFALLLLTASSLANYIAGIDSLVTLLLYMLYICAALLTLSTLTAVAHAREFHSDLVFVGAILVFTLASAAGQLVGNTVSNASINIVVIVATMLYAFVVMLFFYRRWQLAFETEHPVEQLNNVDKTADYPNAASELPENPLAHRAKRCCELTQLYKLTAREQEILLIMADGHGSTYISEV
jgi:hypothetical protein